MPPKLTLKDKISRRKLAGGASLSDLGTELGFFQAHMIPAPAIMVERFNRMGANIKSTKEPLVRAVREVMSPSIRTNFEVGGRPKWKSLESTVIEESQAFEKSGDWSHKGRLPLTLTGKTKNAASAQARWNIRDGAAFFSNWPGYAYYGIFHQLGYINARTGRPVVAREFLMIQPQDEEAIEDIFLKWLEERVMRVV